MKKNRSRIPKAAVSMLDAADETAIIALDEFWTGGFYDLFDKAFDLDKDAPIQKVFDYYGNRYREAERDLNHVAERDLVALVPEADREKARELLERMTAAGAIDQRTWFTVGFAFGRRMGGLR